MANFHAYSFQCPQCDADAEIVSVSFRVDGTIRFEGVCMNCETELSSETTVTEVLSWAAIYDEIPRGYVRQYAKC